MQSLRFLGNLWYNKVGSNEEAILRPNMHKKLPFWMTIAVVLGVWLLVNWVAQTQVEARQSVDWSLAAQEQRPLQQSCPDGPDLVIQRILLDPDPPGAGGPYNVHVEIANDGVVTATENTWAYLFVDRPPTGTPDVQAFSFTGGLASGSVITTHFPPVPGEYATIGFHFLSILIDALDEITEPATCDGEENNSTTEQFEIQGVATPTPTPTEPASIEPPQIYFFTPAQATIVPGQTVLLRWQAYGEAVSVYLDGELVPIEDERVVQPTENHVYTLRAENPGGFVERTCHITVIDPTGTPTNTPTPCTLATIHQFGATDTSIPRGGTTTLYWDLSGATEAYLDGEGVVGVSTPAT